MKTFLFTRFKRGKNNKKLRVILTCVAIFLVTACSSNPSNLENRKEHNSTKEKPFHNPINQETIYIGTQFNAKKFTLSNSNIQFGKIYYILIQANDEDKMFVKANYYYTINKMNGNKQKEMEKQRIEGYRPDGKREFISMALDKGIFIINLFRNGKIIKTKHFSIK